MNEDIELNISDIADSLKEIAEQLKKLNKLILDISSEVI